MDRISRALEMANRQRGEAPGRTDVAEKPVEIAYTKTERVTSKPRTLRSGRVIAGIAEEPVIDAYRLLRTRVLHRMRQAGWTTLGVTSAGAREGKTLTATNLAISIAMGLRHTVLLVDADLRRPSVHTLFGIEPKRGLIDHLASGVPVEELLINPSIERFVLLPGRRSDRAGSEHLGGQAMEALAEDLKYRYRDRIVVFDLPPVLVGDDVVAFAPRLDALLLVVEDGRTDRDEFKRTAELLEGNEVVGVVLNKTEEVARAYEQYY